MTKAEEILVDLAIEKWPANIPYSIKGIMYNATIQLVDKYPEEIYKEICDICLYREMSIRKIMLDEDYIKCVDANSQKDILTPKGKIAKREHGHQGYLDWYEKDQKEKQWKEIPKKYWHIYDLVKPIITVLITSSLAIPISYFKGYKDGKNNITKSNPLNKPIVMPKKLPKDTGLSLPKTLNK